MSIELNYLDKQVVRELVRGNKSFKKQAIHVYNYWRRAFDALSENDRVICAIPPEIRYMEEVVSNQPDFMMKTLHADNVLRQTFAGL